MKFETTGRVEYLDTAKGIGILLVCIGHACSNQITISQCQHANVIRFVTLFHMALFFFINGMLYNEKYSRKPIQGIVKKVKSYYIPFVIYNLTFWLFHNLFAKYHLISGQSDPKNYAYQGIKAYAVSFAKSVLGFRQLFAGAMWFLEALIVISIVFIFIDFIIGKFFLNNRILLLTVSVSIIVCINRLFNLIKIPYIPESITLMIYVGLNGLLFFYFGYLFKIFQCNDKIEQNKKLYTIILFGIMVCVVFIMRPSIVSVITNKSIPIYQYGIKAFWGDTNLEGISLFRYLLFVLVGMMGIIMTILFSQWKTISKCKVLKVLGQYSLHIMCLQFLAFKIVSYMIIKVYHLPIEKMSDYPVIIGVNGAWWGAYTVVACFLPIMVMKILTIGKTAILYIYKKYTTHE